MLTRILQWLENYFERRIARPTALLRIGIFTLIFFRAISELVPPPRLISDIAPNQDGLPEDKVFCVLAEKGTTKGFRTDMPQKKADEVRIAWIGGSEILIKEEIPKGRKGAKAKKASGKLERDFIPDIVFERIGNLTGRRPLVLMYQMSGEKTYDMYLSVLHALHQEPDLIIVSLNSIWLFSDKAVAYYDDLLPQGLNLLPVKAADWSVYGLFAKPSDIAAGLLSGAFPVIANRYEYNTLIERGITRYVSPVKNPGKRDQLLPDTPIQFWLKGEVGIDKASPAIIQEEILKKYFNDSVDGINAVILKNMLNAIADKKIPALLYTHPINPHVLNDAVIAERINSIKETLTILKDSSQSENIDIWFLNPGHSLAENDYRGDLMHLKNAEELITLLQGRILEKHGEIFQRRGQ